jgi:hypothetical protein
MEHFDARRNVLALKALFDSQLQEEQQGAASAPDEDYAKLAARKPH